MSHSSKLSNPNKGLWKPSIYNWLGRSTGDNLDLPLTSRVGRKLCGHDLCSRGICLPRIVNARIELVWDTQVVSAFMGGNPHLAGVRNAVL